MVYVFCAFYGECSQLIRHYNLKKRQADKYYRFDVFENEDLPVRIILTGQGSVMAAAAVSGAASFFGINPDDVIINLGTCAGDYGAGKVFICNKITEEATGRTFYPDMILRSSLSEKELVTVPTAIRKPIHKYADKDSHNMALYDMEAAAIYQAANLYVGPHRMGFVKVVSDNGDIEGLTPDFIKGLMAEAVDEIASYVDMLVTDAFDKLNSGKNNSIQQQANQLCKDLHCSKVMENQVRQLIRYLSLEGTDYMTYIGKLYDEGKLPAHDKKNGKVCLDEIKRELL